MVGKLSDIHCYVIPMFESRVVITFFNFELKEALYRSNDVIKAKINGMV